MEEGGAWSLGAADQTDVERRVHLEASEQLARYEVDLEDKRLRKAQDRRSAVLREVQLLQRRIEDPRTRVSQRESARAKIAGLKAQDLPRIDQEIAEINERLTRAQQDPETAVRDLSQKTSTERRPDESVHDFLVRTGKITPFAKPGAEHPGDEPETRSHRDLETPAQRLARLGTDSESRADEEWINEEEDEPDESIDEAGLEDEGEATLPPDVDDGVLSHYERRLAEWTQQREALRKSTSGSEEDVPEYRRPHPSLPDAQLDERFSVPGDVWASLFGYQKTAVRWMWELYSQKVGGIIGDEMGLGKTVQVAAFLAGLHYSGLLKRPVLIVCPATVLKQWVAEIHQWWPPLRVAILHSIGTAFGNERYDPAAVSDSSDSDDSVGPPSLSLAKARALVSSIFRSGHVLITTYAGVKIYQKILLPRQWAYCCLDEGHKIRNPDAEVSLVCKQIKTPYRLILSGTPIQNNLVELWSLLDFVFPGRLGTLPVFQSEFALPINVGGYANATNIQVQTAYKCAVLLRDIIAPYMLRRMKSDVASDLPPKTEKVLFCKLTRTQHEKYTEFLKSEELASILSGRRQVLFGVDYLRKICNHPDLAVDKRHGGEQRRPRNFGDPAKSGKMQVVKALLDLWHQQGHRALLFCQTRQMLDILEMLVRDIEPRKYMRMDGTTPISRRQELVDSFNSDPTYEVFLLTTKVGGLGVNLTGADRVIIYDPDWNPSTDIQARERAWRLGQKKEVIIYRLMIAGSIEEKIYHRQIFKQFLTNKILQDPRQRRFFKNSDLRDLFTLGDSAQSAKMFDRSGSGTPPPSKRPRRSLDTRDDDLADADIAGLSREADFDEGKETEPQRNTQESDLLSGIFAKAGVQSTLEHDAIMGTSRPDTVLMEREAARIAAQASEALKASRREARQHKIGTPTWTGRSGLAGREGAASASPPASSAGILQGLRQKRDLESKTRSSHALEAPELRKHTQIARAICDYLSSMGDGGAPSQQVISQCHIDLKTDQDIANLRHILRQVAEWDSDRRHWVLKPELKQATSSHEQSGPDADPTPEPPQSAQNA